MVRNHIKRLTAPKTWPIHRKAHSWVAKPNQGTHSLDSCVSLGTFLKEFLKICKNSREVKFILSKKLVKIDGKVRRNIRFPVGLMDIITVKDNNYRILFNTKGKLSYVEVSKEEAKLKPKKIIGKTSLKGNKLQINLFDGTNLLSDKKEFKTNDTLVFSEGKLKEKVEFKEGAFVYITGGKQIGKVGVLKKIGNFENLQPKKIIFNDGKSDFETLGTFAFVIGKDKPLITLPNE
jgi:small subunit ribosomal protein S4e